MTGGRTKCTAIVNQVLYPYSMELVQEYLKDGIPFSIATDASNKGNRKIFFQLRFNISHQKTAFVIKFWTFMKTHLKIQNL